MNQEYCCPYCGQNSYAKTSKKQGNFISWDSVIRHLPKCKHNNHSFIIVPVYGVIPVQEILDMTAKELHNKYPNAKIYSKLKSLRRAGFVNVFHSFKITYSKQSIIETIKKFVKNYNRIPSMREFTGEYPAYSTVVDMFGSWNNAIEAAGYEPNIQNGFGYDTYGLDGHLYRSRAEAYFADTYLYNKYKYVIEPKYPEPYYKYYDWYIPSLDLYIELDGGCRPETIKEKIAINKLLNNKLLLISINDVYEGIIVIQ